MKKILDKFGESLVHEVRDISVAVALKSLRGQMKSDESKELHRELSLIPENTRLLIEKYATEMIDSTIHNFLAFFEGSQDFLLTSKEDGDELIDLNEISDGLAGELFTEEGWIARFSALDSLIE
ncbi:hypothetical protein SH449x_001216 [Pirellulaceae bacterium SH449]